MRQKSETPHGGGASRSQLGGWLRDPLTPLEVLVQMLVASHRARPELATIIAAIAFGGHGNG